MSRPIEVSVSTSEFLAAGEIVDSAAAKTSLARISPHEPDPFKTAILTPRSCARRRALGEILALGMAGGSAEAGATGASRAGADVVWLGAADDDTSRGGLSPGRTIHAMVLPTGTTAPACTLTPASTPSASASISITALSVSISRRISPFATLSPSFFRQATSLPVSCAISRAGITTLKGIFVSHHPARNTDSLANRYLCLGAREFSTASSV